MKSRRSLDLTDRPETKRSISIIGIVEIARILPRNKENRHIIPTISNSMEVKYWFSMNTPISWNHFILSIYITYLHLSQEQRKHSNPQTILIPDQKYHTLAYAKFLNSRHFERILKITYTHTQLTAPSSTQASKLICAK